MEEYKISEKFLDGILERTSKTLVGILCKRVEVLEKNNTLSPKLYKDIVKEHIYEYARYIKALIKSFNDGVEFKTKPKEKE